MQTFVITGRGSLQSIISITMIRGQQNLIFHTSRRLLAGNTRTQAKKAVTAALLGKNVDPFALRTVLPLLPAREETAAACSAFSFFSSTSRRPFSSAAAASGGLHDCEGLSDAGVKDGVILEVSYAGTPAVAEGVPIAWTKQAVGTKENGPVFPELLAKATKGPPTHVKAKGLEEGTYTVIFTDPDAPSKEMPTFREFIHMVATNVTLTEANYQGGWGNFEFDKANICVPYVGAGPPCNSGLHRYIFLVYKQGGADPADKLVAELGDRGGKKAAVAAKAAGLGDPVAIGGFVSEWDESVDALHEAIGFLPPGQYRSPKQIEKHGKE